MLYLTLELPKRIINDAIGAETDVVDFYGFELEQIPFLGVLCILFLVAILGHGLLKMRINTMKGILSERMLRRFRYSLISRILRFPQPYFRRTSQAELVSMATAEAEPLGGLMGDALAQPVLQAGQMITILAFLFMQSFWLGLAAVALIPLQAWLIPKLQRQVNLLNKERIQEVRKLAAEIGENAAGASSLRTNGGWRYRMAKISKRLGILFDIRFQIYQKKFFMKFINNFITQLTPFFFFSVGGFLVIKGNLTLGALVAGLAAYKDLSGPWKELLAYYNQVQDMSLRWTIITQRFAPKGMVAESLFEDEPEILKRLSGDIILKDVTVRDVDGDIVLDDLNAALPKGSTIGITSDSEADRRAIADLLTREIVPSRGNVTIANDNMASLHQAVIAARIGHINSRPHVFSGTVGQNVTMPLHRKPNVNPNYVDEKFKKPRIEALKSGNSADDLNADWLDPKIAGYKTDADIGDWWLKLVDGLGSGNALFRRGVDQPFQEKYHPELAAKLIELRPLIAEKIEKAGLEKLYFRFDEEKYNPELPLAGNLLFATPRLKISQQKLADRAGFLDLLRELDLAESLLKLSQDVIQMLTRTFGQDGTDHPLFQKINLDPEFYDRAIELTRKSRVNGGDPLSEEELALLLTVPFSISAEQIGAIFTDEMKEHILMLRRNKASQIQPRFNDLFAPIAPNKFVSSLTVLENALYGKLSKEAGSKTDVLKKLVADTLLDAGLKRLVAELIYDFETGLDGAGLSSFFEQRIAFNRAMIKRPDIIILERALMSSEPETRAGLPRKMREFLPDATIIFIDEKFADETEFDILIELEDGRITTNEITQTSNIDDAANTDLTNKMRALSKPDMFKGLDRKQLRLLAFGARWYKASAGDTIFQRGDDGSDGAYLLIEGEAGLYYPNSGRETDLISTVVPGRLVGDITLIRGENRWLDMRAHTDVVALRVGRDDFLSVVEHDASTAMSLLKTVSGYLMDVTERRNNPEDQS
ncbi:ABC transporter transmembrane domain-containing protein [Amylibacter sp. SFDW26]|uniref:ABC transporter transmembrane domain-containing protein n=1 Tax=Amylibacter sp. SFDW26 TaxID=2652722 RepID=UPI001D01DAD5|nr:ABC transporter transmembrane domain-containing protein [Amylibacter sp. SFDW26]